MSFAIVAAITAVSTVYTATQQVKAGKAQAEEMLRVQQEEELQAKREELNRTLAANQLAMATSGISGMTPESIALESARQVSSSEAAIGLSKRLQSAQRARQAKNIAKTAETQAVSTLLSGATDIYKMS